MKQKAIPPQHAALGLLALALLLLFFRLDSVSLFQVAEARNAECAREMLERKDWVVPVFNGQLRTDKPILPYWAMMVAYRLGGVNEGSARFFSALCGLAVILSTFWLAQRHAGRRAAILSTLVLLSSAHTLIQFRLATPDPYLLLCHTLSLFCFWEGWVAQRFRWFAALYVFIGIGLLAKGPVALLLPALTIFLFLLATKKLTWKTIQLLKPWWGLLLVLLVGMPWFVLVSMRTHGQWTYGFLHEHNINRFQNTLGQHGGPFLLTLLFVLLGLLPFSVFMVRAMGHAWRERKKNAFLFFSFLSFLVVVLFYCFSKTRLINYTTPAYPFLAITTGIYLSSLFEKRTGGLKPELLALFGLSIIIPVGLFVWLWKTEPFGSIRHLAFLFLVLPAGMLIALFNLKQQGAKTLYGVAGCFILFSFLLISVLFPAIDKQTPIRKRQDLLDKHQSVVAYASFNDAFVFYHRQPIPVLRSDEEMRQFLQAAHHTLIVRKGGRYSVLDSLPSVHLIGRDKEVFSSQYSAFYVTD